MATDIFDTGLQLFVEANETPGAGGSIVSTLTDLSTNGRNMTAASAQPVIESGAINGKKAIVWNGAKNPLKNSDTFHITSGFLVVNISDFTNYNGLLSSLANYGILVGNHHLTDKWFDFGYDYFEYRLNDRIFPDNFASAPVDEWGIVFFRFWRGLMLDGIQLGSDRSFPGRKLNGKVAMMALYDRSWCEQEIRQMFRSIGASYGMSIENVFPYQGSKSDTYGIEKVVLSDGQPEPVLRLKVDTRKTPFDLNFNFRSQDEFRSSRNFWIAHHPLKSFLYRDYAVIPPEDTITRLPERSAFEFRGTNGVSVNYGFTGVESEELSPGAIPSAPTGILHDPVVVVTDDEVAIVTYNENIVVV
jgi:hypothetical protein